MSEEERAAAHREQRRTRRQWERDNAVRMRGDDDAAATVLAGWQPLIDAARDERRYEAEDEERHDRGRWSPP